MSDKDKLLDFMRSILVLKEFYTNFDFVLMDENKKPTKRLELWYQVLGHVDGKTLEQVIFDYVKTNIYPPQSPAHILNHYKEMYVSSLPNANDAYDYVLSVWRDRNKGDYDRRKVIKYLEDNGKIVEANTFKMIQNHFSNTATTEAVELWGRKDFIANYKETTKEHAHFAIAGGTQLKLGTQTQKENKEKEVLERLGIGNGKQV